ncbi:hypothetical protein AB1Y20_022984 [Prymnesium parvum]|uniref:Zn(2)-C6 fungal-type domain-containing protein n=1 Tax=Prymnesium parvum TaxID=97485 RepID=A0AB34JCH5_PRYPA
MNAVSKPSSSRRASSICVHSKRRTRCADCGGGSLCVHAKRKDKCTICNVKFIQLKSRLAKVAMPEQDSPLVRFSRATSLSATRSRSPSAPHVPLSAISSALPHGEESVFVANPLEAIVRVDNLEEYTMDFDGMISEIETLSWTPTHTAACSTGSFSQSSEISSDSFLQRPDHSYVLSEPPPYPSVLGQANSKPRVQWLQTCAYPLVVESFFQQHSYTQQQECPTDYSFDQQEKLYDATCLQQPAFYAPCTKPIMQSEPRVMPRLSRHKRTKHIP